MTCINVTQLEKMGDRGTTRLSWYAEHFTRVADIDGVMLDGTVRRSPNVASGWLDVVDVGRDATLQIAQEHQEIIELYHQCVLFISTQAYPYIESWIGLAEPARMFPGDDVGSKYMRETLYNHDSAKELPVITMCGIGSRLILLAK